MENVQTVRLYCSNCGQKCISHKDNDKPIRLICPRCGVRIISKKIDKRTTGIRAITPA